MINEKEQTLILLKPEIFERPESVRDDVLRFWIDKGYTLRDKKNFLNVSRDVIESHYEEHKGKPFFNGLVDHMCKGCICAIIFEGPNVVAYSRKILGATDPQKAEPWTIRGRFALYSNRNMVHASDSIESAKREIKIWFE